MSADLGGIPLGEVLYKDVAGLGFREDLTRLGAPRTLAKFCALGCSSNLATSLVNRGARKRHFRLSGRSASERALLSRGRPLLHETLLLGSRSALRTTEHAETQKIAIWRPPPGDPLTMSHFGPPDSIRRRVGRPLSRGRAWPRLFRAGHTGRKAIYQAV